MAIFGKYDIVPARPGGSVELGRGGMSIVYSAKDPSGRMVALKVLHPERLKDAEARARFALEPKLYPLHPNIVRIYDAGQVNNTPYFAMELVQGASLQDWIKKNGVPAAELALVVKDVAAALDAVHQRGIIHRDIKPSNILIRASDKHVFLTDFGVARDTSDTVERMTRVHSIGPGTAAYMSPEQIDGDGELTPASDVYSFAASVYHALVGKPPFNFEDDAVVRLKHVSEMPTPPHKANPAVSRAVSDVVMRGLDKHKDKRFTSAGQFANAYLSALIPAKNAGFPWKVAAAVGAGVVALGLMASALSNAPRPTPTPSPVASPIAPNTSTSAVATRPPTQAPPAGSALPAPTPTPAGAGNAVPPTATLAPTPTPAPRATITPTLAAPAQGIELIVPTQGGSQQFYRPPANQPCSDFIGSDKIVTWRFTVNVVVKNGTDADFSNWRAVLVERPPGGANQDILTCGRAPTVRPNESLSLTFFGDSDSQSVVALELRDEAQTVLKRVCFNGNLPVKC